MPNITILKGHVSPETAYVVEDYPYGYKLRCKIRYWIEYKNNFGFRFVSQTTNPKKPLEHWNAPKAGTYFKFGMCMYLEHENGHVSYSGLHQLCDGAEAKAWQEKYGEGVPEARKDTSRRWIAAKVAYDAARKPGDPLSVGMKEAVQALVK
jgi:hypothetical protein